MGHIGDGFQILGLMAGAASAVLYAAGFRSGKGCLRYYGNLLRAVMFVSVAVSAAVLCWAVFSNDFSLRYVSLYSDRTLPFFYKISVLWAGQSGALLIACLVLSFFGVLEAWRLEKAEEKYACAVNLVNVFFCCAVLAVTVFVVSPFAELDFIPVNGSGLFPALQNKYVFLYPLFMCFWIAGALAVFSHASAALITRDLSSYWIRMSRFWLYATWLAAAAALLARSFWSYAVAGDFWNWNVQEVSGVLAVVALTALIHSSMVYEAKGRMKAASFLYAFIFFEAALFSQYLTHSGADDVIKPFKYVFCGSYIAAAMIFSSVFFALLLAANRKGLKITGPAVLRPEYAVFKILNRGFAAVIFFMFAGMLFQMTAGGSLNPGGYYLFVIIPSAVFTVFFIAFVQFYPILRGRLRRGRGRRECKKTLGGMAAHAGLILVFAGVGLSSVFYSGGEITLHPGGRAFFGGYEIKANGVESMQKDNYVSTFVDISLSSGKKVLGNIYPEIRGYNNSNKLIAETKSAASGFGVVSVAFLSYDFSSKEIRLLIMDYPFILIMAPGFLLIAFGVVRAMRRGWNN